MVTPDGTYVPWVLKGPKRIQYNINPKSSFVRRGELKKMFIRGFDTLPAGFSRQGFGFTGPYGYLVGEPGASLTRHGAQFLPSARALLRAAAHAVSLVRAGQPALGASSNVGIYMLHSHLRRYQDLDLRIGPNPDVQAWLLNGELDLAVVEWWPAAPGFDVLPWREERLVMILPPGHRLARQKVLPIEALFEEPLLGGEAGTGTGTLLREALGADASRIRVSRNLGSTEAVKQAVAAGLGVSLVLESAVDEERRAGSLVVRPLDGAALAKRILVVLPTGTPPTSPARDLVRVLMEARR